MSSQKKINKKVEKIISTGKNRTPYQKIMYFLFEDESLISWLVCLFLCFLVIVFIFFPFFRLLFSTSLPFVLVESGSMEHNNLKFDNWWNLSGSWYEARNITKEQFSKWTMHNGFNTGDIIVVMSGKYEKGDIIIFDAGQKTPIIHRIVEISNETMSTKGDNNQDFIPADKNIQKEKIVGKAIMRIPKAGNVKLAFCKACPACCSAIEKIMSIGVKKP